MAKCDAVLKHRITGEVLLRCDLVSRHDFHYDGPQNAEWRQPSAGVKAALKGPHSPRRMRISEKFPAENLVTV